MSALPADEAAVGGVRAPVLVADDDSDVRTMVRMLLELDGHRVLEAKDGSVAWELIQSHKPAVVVADVQMPGMTGLQLCRKVKDSEGGATIKVIVYTAGMASREESILAGCDAYFLKTDPLPGLRDAVRRFYDLA
ncbi:MAG: response regulator [Chloroflexi bacterium]|nr:MAG: response regulator [Chloroflexota bacterium]TMD53929.1 MAG: response regulator [Chloroflexota bacterium]